MGHSNRGVSKMQGTPWHIEYLREPVDETLVIPTGKKRRKKSTPQDTPNDDRYADLPDGYILSRKITNLGGHVKKPKRKAKCKPSPPTSP